LGLTLVATTPSGLYHGSTRTTALVAEPDPFTGQLGVPSPRWTAPVHMVESTAHPSRSQSQKRELPKVGDVVRVRSRQYLVEDVTSAEGIGAGTHLRLSCLDDDAQGVPLEVLWELEVDAERCSPDTWSRVAERGFDPARLFSAYYHTLRWGCVTATDPRMFQAPYRAGIQVLDYQLEPLRKALLLPRVNLFIADDVGLGKTIEAGLILRELLLRQKVRRVVVACPKSVVVQWQQELEQRFGLSLVIYDRDYVQRCRRERGFGVNPWATHSRFLISQSLLADEAYASPLRDWLGDFAPGSILILDEAHHAAPASGEAYAVDSLFTRTIRDLAPRFEHRLFLSATPHNGHSNSFAALMEILDPQRFCRGVPVRSDALRDQVMVRRLKEDLRDIVPGIPKREIITVPIDGLPEDAPELVLPRLLSEYKALRESRLAERSRGAQAAAALVITSLQKRLLSSIEAFAFTLRVHRRAVERAMMDLPPVTPTAGQLLLSAPGQDDERADLDEAEVAAEEEAIIARASPLPGTSSSASTPELALLDEMARIADGARGLPDPRVHALVDWIRENCCPGLGTHDKPGEPGAPWNDRRVIVFTEYADTKRYLYEQLMAVVGHTHLGEARIGSYHGGMNDAAREAIKRGFNAHPEEHPLRILIATDAAREGINLQNYCADLFHFDVPWNPSRLEQRNGRIDRKLQRSTVVRCRTFVHVQRPEDSVLRALVAKTRRILEELGSLPKVIEDRLDRLFRSGIDRSRTGELVLAIESVAAPERQATVEEELESTRLRREKIKEQLDGLRTLKDESRQLLALSEEHLQDALSLSLELSGAPALAEMTAENGSRRFRVPALDRLPGADVTWADDMDALREPRAPDCSVEAWRAQSPVQPVVFEDPGTLESGVVHLHLDHRLVKRLLARFSAQGFVHHDLSRACVTQSRDPRRRVVVIGRLSVFGHGAARLHEEIVVVTALWTPPDERQQPLKPYATAAEERTMELLEGALGDASSQVVSTEVTRDLRVHVERDLAELLPHLETRANDALEKAERLLGLRGEREAREMVGILEGQRSRIQKLLASRDMAEFEQKLLFEEDQTSRVRIRRQLEAEQRYQEARLESLARELEEEPTRIRDTYTVKAHRVEPVGVVYIWPADARLEDRAG
jgi:hypothetical protein